ncbi:BCCT family transporter [Allobacillus sp. SKP2-8]|uniref:BCCT family transporter n=1 Tax=unclassified Allobacillus TaxID=2628859 RepID=UPI0011836376|nr:BCCT family transporter [Allobacillus sp. SKP2-8]TSJ66089.1 BCCT family transporter [Allobacillus sp. SKP2-8]
MKKDPVVFYAALAIMSIIVFFGIVTPNLVETITNQTQGFIINTFGWYYLVSVSLIVLACIYLFISPVGKIKLGKPDEKPEFSRPTWIAMLFSAGIGIGLIFYGAYEPLSHYAINSPTGELGTDQGIKDAMRYTYFHYGIHPWSIYGIVALAIAYFGFRKGEISLISKTLRPIIGKHADGTTGKVIDIVAVISTIMGVATSLGFGAIQINGGLSFLFDIPKNLRSQTIIIIIVTILFMISALTGIGKGIKYLSNINMSLSLLLFLALFFLGSTLFTLNLLVTSVGGYFQNIIQMSLRIAPLNEDIRGWINDWTIFYWAWWIAWSPFVGLFIARVSRGRSIREFVTFVLLAPTILSFIWFTTFGSAAITTERAGISISSLLPEESLFGVLETYPIGMVLSILTILIIVIFFVTSADSGTFVLGMMTSNGIQNPTRRIKAIWGIFLSLTALALIYSGGLLALQNAMIVAALPFSVVIILMAISLITSLRREAKELGIRHQRSFKRKE